MARKTSTVGNVYKNFDPLDIISSFTFANGTGDVRAVRGKSFFRGLGVIRQYSRIVRTRGFPTRHFQAHEWVAVGLNVNGRYYPI